MIIGICLVFAGLLAAMNIFISRYIQSGNEKTISDELAGMNANGQIYVRQFLAVGGGKDDADGFAAVAQDAARELANATGSPTAVYTAGGALLAASREGVFETLQYGDLREAMAGNPAFTLDTVKRKTTAYCSYPVTMGGRDVGIVRTVIDCTALYASGNNMMHSVSLITGIMFLVALLVSIFFIQNISSPLTKLAALSSSVARSIERNTPNSGSIDTLLRTRRKDEVGRLSRNFAEMIRKIDQQMSVISTDRAELQRLAEYRKEFYDSVTHELKSPLTSIGGYAEVLEENGFTDKAFFYKGIGHIKTESARMYAMVVSLLEMSKLSTTVNYPKEVMDFSALVEEACDSMRFKAEKYGTAIERDIDPEIRVFGGPDKLREVLINLLDNAIKYKLPEGNIHVIVRNRGRMAQVSVINAAEPIPAEELPRLFEPFYQTGQAPRREEGSSGLGLAICKQIVEQHAGRIGMRNLPGGNLVVEAALPIYKGL